MEKGKFYKLTNEAMAKMLERGSDFAIEFCRLNPNNEPFEVTSVDKDGNVLSVLFGKFNKTKSLHADIGFLSDYWCLWLAHDKSLVPVPSDEAIEKIDAPDWFVMTSNPAGTTNTSGPMTEEKAREFAVSQCKNASEGVRVRILKVMGEAFLKVEIK
jgi:hypothetical protein